MRIEVIKLKFDKKHIIYSKYSFIFAILHEVSKKRAFANIVYLVYMIPWNE
jgi:hypothetical protein